MKKFHKLVRDRIPEIIANDYSEGKNRVPMCMEISKRQHYQYLCDKLIEELEEFIESESVEELVDIVEVCRTIAFLKGVNSISFSQMIHQKNVKRGGFTGGTYLVGVKTYI